MTVPAGRAAAPGRRPAPLPPVAAAPDYPEVGS
ncbi:hypothetical protein Tcur_1325 [Thermomonospora curvata DSM 43183]|uniref:Uncharacterized protein n=1 Tax=Thermomonospora curvata (strain ATCC 19995 / DSM 43183 / JCM 3096 / KCTC 9072 / NBRC 15933 / NCIMB 10081 / Henssen B9) TaxID=471852 RepID=D1A9X2_THECD|nr:hypothetical protein Tcur_1325 [Thermomonospora curvata DSM 43183]